MKFEKKSLWGNGGADASRALTCLHQGAKAGLRDSEEPAGLPAKVAGLAEAQLLTQEPDSIG